MRLPASASSTPNAHSETPHLTRYIAQSNPELFSPSSAKNTLHYALSASLPVLVSPLPRPILLTSLPPPRTALSTETVLCHSRLPSTVTPDAALDLLHDHDAFLALQPSITSNLLMEPPSDESWLVEELDKQIKFIVAEVFGTPPPDPPRHPWASWGSDPWAIWNGNGKWELAMRLRTSFRELTTAAGVTTSAYTTFQRGILVVHQEPSGVRRVSVWWIAEGEEEKAETTGEEAEGGGSAGVEGKEVESFWYLIRQATTTADPSLIEPLLADEQAEHVELVKRFFAALEEKAVGQEKAGAEEKVSAEAS